MTTDSRKLVVAPVVDATGAKAGFQEIKAGGADMAQSLAKSGQEAAKGFGAIGDGAAAASAKVDRETSNLVRAIERATAKASAAGKGPAEMFRVLGEQRGANPDVLKPYLSNLEAALAKTNALTAATRDLSNVTTSLGASNYVKPLGNPTTSLGATGFGAATAVESQKAAAAATQSLDKIGISAKQTAAAMRGVPAQFTDIVTSIQGGQAPLTVLLQQGGQLKDMFGGVGPAVKALGSYVLGLVNPFTVAAAAVGTLGVAYFQGAKESEAFNKSLILTGNYLGLTVSGLQTYAKTISATVGTQGAAAEALTALANSGKVAKESLTAVGTAVVYMNRVLGQSVDEATATFVKLADEPTKASQKLNESMHYLNLATYERIRALEEQGNKEAAAALAQKTLADETTSRLQKVEAGAGSLERGWRSLADGAKSAWDAMLGIGRAKSIGDALSEAQGKLNEARAQASKGGAYAALYGPSVKKGEQDVNELSRRAVREQEAAFAEGEKARTEAAKIGASQRIKILDDETKTNADKRKKAIADLNRDFLTLGKATSGAEYDKLVANINEKFKDPKSPKVKAFQDDQGTKTLETLRQQEAALKAQLDTNDKLTAADQERAKYLQLFADLKTKGILTADQKSLLANQDAIKAQLDKNVAVEAELELKKAAVKEAERIDRLDKQFTERARQRTEAISSSRDSQNEQYDRIRATFGLGDRARVEVEAQRSIFREYNKMQLDLVKNTPEHLLGSDKFKEESQKIREGLNSALDAQKQFYADEKTARESWLNGATSALANYIDYVNDAASRTKELVNTTLGGITDGLTGAIMGDKGSSFKDMGKKIAEQITRGIVEQQITKPIAEWLQGSLKDPDSMVGKLLGGLTSNKDTGENWLGFLGLGGGKAGAGVAPRGSTMATPLYVQSVGGSLGGAANDSNGGGGGIFGMLGNLFGGGSMSNGAATAAANSMGGDALDNLIKLQGGWGTIAGFAGGGDPPVGRISMVGENGPELFVPRQAGTIIPNSALQQRGGGGNVINLNFQPGQVDRRTGTQISNDVSLELRRAGRMG